MATRSLNVPITGDAKGLGRAVKDADRHLDRLGKDADKAGGKLKAGLTTGAKAAGLGVAAGVGIAAMAVKDFTDAAKESEVSGAKMRAQLKASGLSFKQHGDEIDRVIAKQSKLSGLDDEDLQDSFTNLVRVTGDVNKALNLNAVASDFARAKNMDVAKAGELVGKVAGGNIGILGRYGIQVKKGATETEALALLQEKFAGQAKAYGDTAAGAQEKFAVTIGNVKETLGAALLPTLTDVTNKVNDFVSGMMDGTGAGGEFADKAVAAFETVKDVAGTVWPVLRDGGEVALGLFTTGFERAKTVVEAFGDGVSAIQDWAREHRDQINSVVDTIRSTLGGAIDWLRTALPAAFEAVKGAITSTFTFISDWITRNRDTIIGVAQTIAGALGTAFNAAKSAVVVAFDAIKTAVSAAVEFVSGWIDEHRDDIEAFGNAWKNIGIGIATVVGGIVLAVKWAFETVIAPVIKRVMSVVLDIVKTVWPSIKRIVEGALEAIGGIINVFSGIFTGDFDRIWDGVKGIFRGGLKAVRGLLEGAVKGLYAAAKGVGGGIKDGVVAGVRGLAGLLGAAIKGAVTWVKNNLAEIAGGILGGIGGAIRDAIIPGGDGIGKRIGDGIGKSLPAFGGGLQGMRAHMAPVVGAAARFGLNLTSGLRPGSITSSGNLSYHGTGEAGDFSGPPASMLGFFRFMKNTLGGRLAELIYTPGGVGVRNGSPHTYSGAVAADHFDHVHVAIDSGAPGVGDGIGQIRSLWTSEGGDPSKQNLAAAVAMAESSGNANASNRNSDGSIDRGLWQINSIHGSLSTFNRGGNARAAIKISGNGRNWNPWVAFKKGMHTKFLSSGGDLPASKGAGAAKNGKGTSGTASGGPSGSVTPDFYAAPDAPSDEQQRVIDFVANRGNPLVAGTRPAKGGGPTKGFTPAEVEMGMPEALAAAREANAPPTWEDIIGSNIARATLTEGTEDDIAAASHLEWYRRQIMDQALADGDVRNDAEAISSWKSATDQLKALNETVADQNEITRRNTEALEAHAAELKQTREFAAGVQATETFQIKKYLADVLSGEFGRGVVSRGFTAGTGVEVAW